MTSRAVRIARRMTIGALLGLTAIGVVLGAAATLPIEDRGIASGTTAIASCDPDGITTTYDVGYDTTEERYEVSGLAIGDIAPACVGGTLQVVLLSSADVVIADSGPIPVTGYAWVVPVGANDATRHVLDGDTVMVVPQGSGNGTVRVRVGPDTVMFDLRPLADRYADSAPPPGRTPMTIEAASGTRRAALVLTNLSGQRKAASLATVHWGGSLLLGE